MIKPPVTDIIVRPDYRVAYEQWDDVTFVHVTVHRWSAGIARQFRADIDAAHRLLGRPVYVLRLPEAPLQPKFLALHGFVPCGSARAADGRVVEAYVRNLDHG